MTQGPKPAREGGKSRRREAWQTVLHKQTPDMVLKGYQVRASHAEPQYIVPSDNGGKATHKPSALTKI